MSGLSSELARTAPRRGGRMWEYTTKCRNKWGTATPSRVGRRTDAVLVHVGREVTSTGRAVRTVSLYVQARMLLACGGSGKSSMDNASREDGYFETRIWQRILQMHCSCIRVTGGVRHRALTSCAPHSHGAERSGVARGLGESVLPTHPVISPSIPITRAHYPEPHPNHRRRWRLA